MDNMRDSLKVQFSNLGFPLSENVLDKCVELCINYNIDEETVVETWTAFSLTNLNGEPPTIQGLSQMERKEFENRETNSSQINNSHQSVSPHSQSKNISCIKIETESSRKKNEKSLKTDISLIKNNKPGFGQERSTDESTILNSDLSPFNGKHTRLNPAQINSENLVAEFLPNGPREWTGKHELLLSIAPYNDHSLSSNCKLMREPLSKKADVLNNNIEHIGECLIKRNGLQEPSSNSQVNPTDVVCVGRVCCDSNDRLNPSSVMLEGSRNVCMGQCVLLDLSRLSNYSLFPGQIIAVVGTNVTGQRFLVKKLFSSAPLSIPPHLPSFKGAMEMVIAAGPFSVTDHLNYEPLETLMTYVNNYKPHVLILIGPIVCLKNVQSANGPITETYSDLFQSILNRIVDQLKGSWTQVIYVSSANDAVCLPVYPTPALSNNSSLYCFSDPCMLNINGIVIGITATDSLMHLGKEEICFPDGRKNLLGRVASYLLDQQSFYPLYPPYEELSVDLDLWDFYANLEVTPHLLIVPSNFRCFIKELRGCLVVNPRQVVNAHHVGSFARIEIEPPAHDGWAPSTHISAQIIQL